LTGRVSVLEIYKLLPRTNCRKCGMTCMSFAAKLLRGEVSIEMCPVLFDPEYKGNLEKLREILPKKSDKPVEVVDPDKCSGCGNCVVACPANVAANTDLGKGLVSVSDKLIFLVVNGRVELLHPEYCRRLPPTKLQCRVCEESCYMGIIRVYEV